MGGRWWVGAGGVVGGVEARRLGGIDRWMNGCMHRSVDRVAGITALRGCGLWLVETKVVSGVEAMRGVGVGSTLSSLGEARGTLRRESRERKSRKRNQSAYILQSSLSMPKNEGPNRIPESTNNEAKTIWSVSRDRQRRSGGSRGNRRRK